MLQIFQIFCSISKTLSEFSTFNLLNNLSKESTNDFVELLAENTDLKKMYLQHLKS